VKYEKEEKKIQYLLYYIKNFSFISVKRLSLFYGINIYIYFYKNFISLISVSIEIVILTDKYFVLFW